MLVKKGDWLVRRSEVNNQAKHVVSIFWDGEAKHVVLHKTDKGNRYMLDKEKDFANIQVRDPNPMLAYCRTSCDTTRRRARRCHACRT